MYRQTSKLIIYGAIPQDSILMQMADIYRQADEGRTSDAVMTEEVYTQVRHLLETATKYGFDGNLWQNYLTFLLISTETPFSITCEKKGATEGASVNVFAKNDFDVFRSLFHYDFGPLEKKLGISCFGLLENYHAIDKSEKLFNRNVSDRVRELSPKLAAAESTDEFFDLVTEFYRHYGVGMFGLHKAFRVLSDGEKGVRFHAINNMETVHLSDLVGYERQKAKLIENTKAFVEGRKANNCLLYGDMGTGKSTSIKAIVNEYYDKGLRMIEIYKHQFKDLSDVIAQIKTRNYRFIIYMDDLSFEENETEYKFLKAVIEGGVETRPDNILIYATSNRRHLVKETWNDRSDIDQDLHRSETMEEKLSLVSRFGVTINYSKPTQNEYFDIVDHLAAKNGISMKPDDLHMEAHRWEMSHGGLSGRTAQQFINHLLSAQEG
ncbi:MAG: ATP-binding protein [Lachnospiraceae bacterium]|nr:ATP-binding protein [Lachnospiraceae bacterium]MCH4030294.1 ATP-binding protein [Lachnospiraceae bacterium]MCH4069506.1 ATP-binding protein [Lachnospiraceae bacterium]MCH4107558.1 ATP-binding protein [Lachnospiraceae bacterium]MCI1301591.1 ATP-binding protein [Lachnospiraceae bacterium]